MTNREYLRGLSDKDLARKIIKIRRNSTRKSLTDWLKSSDRSIKPTRKDLYYDEERHNYYKNILDEIYDDDYDDKFAWEI